MRSSRTRARLVAGAAVVGSLLLVAACGDDKDEASSTTQSTTASAESSTTAAGMADGDTIKVTAVDYKFDDLPDSIDAGDTLTMHNGSTKEFHEMVVIRIPDSEKRSVEELIALPEDESDAIFANVEPAAVFVAMPGEDAMAVVGDGAITEPGRYAVVCFIPVGADPQKVAEAMKSETNGPPDLGDGPPHASQGMYAELTVK